MDGRDNNFGIDFAPIGQAIKKARIAQNMTREQLAGIIEYSIRHVADHKGIFVCFVYTENNLFFADMDTLFDLIIAKHTLFFILHRVAPFFVFSLSARLKSFGYRHRRK